MIRLVFPRAACAALVAFAVGVSSSVAKAASGDEASERPAVVPTRPTVSAPADLSAPGWLEAEVGSLHIRDRDAGAGLARRDSLPYALKLAFTQDWGVRLFGEAAVQASSADGTLSGGGDTGVVGKKRWAIDERSAVGLEVGADFASARRRLGTGSGRTDEIVDAIYSIDLPHDVHLDANAVGTRLGMVDSGAGRWQSSGAVALTERLDDRWALETELSGTRRRRLPTTAQWLAAATYAIRRDIVGDFGATRALNRATPTWQVFAGLTFIVGRVF